MAAFPGLTPGTWTVDPTHAEVGFVARHLMVAKVPGRFTDVSGTKSWRAYDIIVDEVSMALNWRQQFDKIIQNEGFDSLIAKINKKVDQ